MKQEKYPEALKCLETSLKSFSELNMLKFPENLSNEPYFIVSQALGGFPDINVLRENIKDIQVKLI